MLVKICGITTKEALDAAVSSGADFIGFVFADSKRKIAADEAATITEAFPSTVKKVGVFVNETIENMKDIAEKVGLDVIQLHGDEAPEIAEQLPYEIIKAFPAEKHAIETMKDYPCDYYLIDTPGKKYRGGSGTAFDWELVEDVSKDCNKLILAGGLTPENVRTGIEKINPMAVDVSSGVETEGKKDSAKIKQFITNAKQMRKDEVR